MDLVSKVAAPLALAAVACTTQVPPSTAPAPRPSAATETATATEAPQPANAAASPATEVLRTCELTIDAPALQPALTAWVRRSPVQPEHRCPSAARIVQREPWYVALTGPADDLTGFTADQPRGPSRRLQIGERVTLLALDAASGDAIDIVLGKIDPAALAAAEAATQRRDPDAGPLTPWFDDPQRDLVDDWYGLSFAPRSGAPARLLLGWLAAHPGVVRVEHGPLAAPSIDDLEDSRAWPRALALTGASETVLCLWIDAAPSCWTTDPITPRSWELERDDDDRPTIVRFVATHGEDHQERWELALATGAWRLVGTRRDRDRDRAIWPPQWIFSPRARPRRHAPWRPSPPSKRVFRQTEAPAELPPAFARGWIRAPADGQLLVGDYEIGAGFMALEGAEMMLERSDGRWRAGPVRAREVTQRIPLTSPDRFALILGEGEYVGGDGIGGFTHTLETFAIDGDWIVPTGHLPLPIAAAALIRTEGGWGYAYRVEPGGAECLRLSLDHRIGWLVRASGAMTTTAITLPFDSLAGAWHVGPNGLERGCGRR